MKSQRGAQIDEINITPLTDIFLVLLIIMMVVTPILDYKGVNLAVLTVGAATTSDEKPKTLRVKIGAQGEYDVGPRAVSHDDLANEIKAQIQDNPDGVLIESNPEATHESMTYALAAVQEAGVTKVAIVERAPAKESEIEPPPESVPAPKPDSKPKSTKK